MQGEVIKQFLVGLGFDVDKSSLSSFTKTLGGSALAVTAIGAALNAAGAAVVRFTSEIADGLDRTGDLADRTDNSAESLMRWQYVATLTGSSAEVLNSSIEGLSRTAGEAAIGIGRGAMTFEKLGLSARKPNGDLKTTTELLGEVGEKIRGLSRGEQTATLAKLGIDPTLVQALTTDVGYLGKEFDSLYGSLGVNLDQAANEAGMFNDSLDRMQSVLRAVYVAVAVRLMPQIRRGFDAARQAIVANLPRIVEAVTPILDILLRILEATVTFGSRAAQGIGAALGWFNKFNNAAKGVPGIILGIVAAWKLLNLSFLASPIGAVIALATGIALLVDDYLTWKEGGKSLIDWSKWGPQIEIATKAVTLLGDAINFLADGFISLVSAGAQLGSGVISKIAGWFGGGSAGAGLTPSPSASAALGGNSSSLNQKVEINVAGATDPAATGRAVGGAVARANADAARNLQGATR